jgi:hypothetical protein
MPTTAPSTPGDNIGHRAARGRPSLGDRQHVTAALWPRLEALVDESRGPLDRSPYLADLLAWHIGRPDLLRDTQLAIEFTLTADPAASDAARPTHAQTRHATVRVHPDVAHELDRRASDCGLPRAVFIAAAIAEALGVHQAPTTPSLEEGLPLAM